MDAYIDTEEIESGSNSLRRYIQELSESVSAIESCFDDAINDFDTINYDKAVESVKITTIVVKEMKNNVDQLLGYLQSLSDSIEKYDELKY